VFLNEKLVLRALQTIVVGWASQGRWWSMHEDEKCLQLLAKNNLQRGNRENLA